MNFEPCAKSIRGIFKFSLRGFKGCGLVVFDLPFVQGLGSPLRKVCQVVDEVASQIAEVLTDRNDVSKRHPCAVCQQHVCVRSGSDLHFRGSLF